MNHSALSLDGQLANHDARLVGLERSQSALSEKVDRLLTGGVFALLGIAANLAILLLKK